ncbi:MAG: hypothetical protein QNJ11_05840 [Woeseiaceae bacterium]|nr:hypothetical protein [Woeseiaceae bacterium]
MTFEKLRPLALAVTGAGLLLAGCSSSSDSPDDTPPPNNPPPPTSTNTPQSATPSVTTPTSIGDVFTKASDGLTLYTFENDRNDADGDGEGDSDCNDDCATTWPPLLADGTSTEEGFFTIITRDDGTSLQWAFKGLPLYTFSGDSVSGDVNGEATGGTWFVARPNPYQQASVADTASGTVFVGRGSVIGTDGAGGQASDRLDREGFVLYTFENDRNDTDGDGPGDSDCNGGCAETWPPLYADTAATAGGDFTIIDRDDGTRQWALNGLPLYFFAPDQVPGETSGEGAGGVWYVARPAPIAKGDSSLGPIFIGATSVPGVDANGAKTFERAELAGFSLYVFDNDASDANADGIGDSDCNAGCAVTWPPVFADAGATPTGDFSLITRDDGSRQWAYNEEPLYFFANDTDPGDVTGDEAGGVWHLARTAPLQVVTDTSAGAIFEARGLIYDVDGNGEQAGTLSDRTGFTLYRFDDDRNDAEGDGAGDSDCNGGCAVTWPPLYAGAGDRGQGDFTIIDREDGSRQWAYQGDPLYFFSGDASPIDVNGVYGTWFTVSPEATQESSQNGSY